MLRRFGSLQLRRSTGCCRFPGAVAVAVVDVRAYGFTKALSVILDDIVVVVVVVVFESCSFWFYDTI